jgi:DNA-binding IscR family transcriptional regulator
LSGSLFDDTFCGLHVGMLKLCSNSIDCSVRSLWQNIQYSLDQLLDKITLADLVNSEKQPVGVFPQQIAAGTTKSYLLPASLDSE